MRTCAAASWRPAPACPPRARSVVVVRANSGGWLSSNGGGARPRAAGGGATLPHHLGASAATSTYAAPEVHSVDLLTNAPVVSNGKQACSAGTRGWEQKSDLYLLRSDGHSCIRETVHPSGALQFAHPSSQQHLLVWKQRAKR